MPSLLLSSLSLLISSRIPLKKSACSSCWAPSAPGALLSSPLADLALVPLAMALILVARALKGNGTESVANPTAATNVKVG